MLIALDKNGNRLYANAGEKYEECFCPECGELLIHKTGNHNVHHFAHKPKSECTYGEDKDRKSPWNIRMQEIFPPETMEKRFQDKNTGEIHIADIYLEETNTVIEFQHSPITKEEFWGRTCFHLSEGRRIVWIFDESEGKYEFGRLKRDTYDSHFIYKNFSLEWMRAPRKMLGTINQIKGDQVGNYNNLSILIYWGDEEDTVHRIIRDRSVCEDFHDITVSVHSIALARDMNVEEFFAPEQYWLSQSPWKEKIEEMEQRQKYREALERKRQSAMSMALLNSLAPRGRRRRF